MNHHIMNKILKSMSLIKKYPEVRQSRLEHFSGTWQNSLSFLVAFNRTNYGCMNARANADNSGGKFLEYNSDPVCLDVPKMTSQLDFELSETQSEDSPDKSIYFVRVIYNGESLGICVDSKDEYKKPMSERVFKIYCPLDEFSALMRQQVTLRSYQAICASEQKDKKDLDDDMWRKLTEKAKIEFILYGSVFAFQIVLSMILCWYLGQSSKDLVIKAFDEEYGDLPASERFSLKPKTKSQVTPRKRKFGLGLKKKKSLSNTNVENPV